MPRAPNLNLPKKRVYVRDAPVSRRVLAFLADLFLLDFTVFASFSFLNVSWQDAFGAPRPDILASAVVMSLLALAYFSMFEWVLGQTPGMMLLNLRVEKVTFGKALLRHCYFLPLFPFPILLLTEPLFLFWKKRRWLELLTRTRVVETITY